MSKKNYTPAMSIAAMFERFSSCVDRVENSLELEYVDTPPMNFTNGRNVSFGGSQDHALVVVAAAEGYSTNMWATARQIREAGGRIMPQAYACPVFVYRNNVPARYYSVYNLDSVDWPDGIPMSVYDIIVNGKPKKASKKAPAKAKDTAPKKAPAKKAPAKAKKASAPKTEAPAGNVVVELKELGIRVEAPADEVQAHLELAVNAYVMAKKALS